MKAKRLPADDTGNGWFNILDTSGTPVRPDGSYRSEWAIIGAGISGLTTAMELGLAIPSDSIALIDAQRVGYGPSGRNAGFVVTHHIHAPLKDFATARKKVSLSTAGTEHLRELVKSRQVQCDWNDWGRTYVAYDDASTRQLEEMHRIYERLNLEVSKVSSGSLQAQSGISLYRFGLHVDNSALVNPAAMCRGIAAALPSNVSVFEESPIRKIEIGPPHKLGLADAVIRADNVIFATNTFTAMLGVNPRTVPIAVYASLSEPVAIDGLSGGPDGEFGMMEVLDTGATLRRTRDGRLFVRGGYYTYCSERRVSDRDLKIAEHVHRSDIRKRYPDLDDVELTHTWAGVVGFSRNDAHLFGPLGPGLYANVPFDTSPVSRGALAGRLLVDDILGRDSELLEVQKSLPPPAWLPPEPLLGAFVRRKINRMAKAAGIAIPRQSRGRAARIP